MIVILKPTASASAWTKHRLRTHKGTFTILDRANPLCWSGVDSFRVKCSDGWHGWIPCSEVTLTDSEGKI